MLSASRLHVTTPSLHRRPKFNVTGSVTLSPVPGKLLCFQPRRFTVTSSQSSENVAASPEPSISSEFTSAVGSPSVVVPSSQFSMSHGHFAVLNVAACVVAISATWLFCSAIPTLLAFKRAAESLEKLMDVAREELPSTMAAVRLSGMEISDLTMELSDLGQEITRGVRNSTRAVRIAEERLRNLANLNATAPMQGVTSNRTTTVEVEPVLARSARGIREGIVKGRALLQMFFSVNRFSRLIIQYFQNRSKHDALNK